MGRRDGREAEDLVRPVLDVGDEVPRVEPALRGQTKRVSPIYIGAAVSKMIVLTME